MLSDRTGTVFITRVAHQIKVGQAIIMLIDVCVWLMFFVVLLNY